MGGHSDGSRAADTALKSLLDSFQQTPQPLFDPLGFLHMALSKAHDDVARLGSGQSIDARPRATTAICLVQEGAAYWAHVGDSRVYHIRNGKVVRAHARSQPRRVAAARRQDHRGRAAESSDAQFRRVLSRRRSRDSGNDHQRPPAVAARRCAAAVHGRHLGESARRRYRRLLSRRQSAVCAPGSKPSGRRAVQASAPFSDNSTAAVLRWHGA